MADKKRLASPVAIDGVWYQTGDEPPAEVAERITNPKAWMTQEDMAEANASNDSSRRPGTTSGHRLASTVHVDGAAYGPDDYVPDDVVVRITNPKAWEGGKVPSAAKAPAPAGDGAQPPAGGAQQPPADGQGSDGEDGEQSTKPRKTANRRA